MKRVIFKIILPVAVLAILVGGFLSLKGAAQSPAKMPAQEAVPVKVTKVLRQDVPIEIHALGTVVPYQSVSVSARLDSQITKVNFRDGDTVKKGDMLFTLDDRTVMAQLNQSKADLARDMALVESLRKEHERNKTLIKQKAISQQALDDSKAALDAQVAAVEAGKSAVESNAVLLDYTIIKAPIDGRTGIVNVTQGNNVQANAESPLVTINQIRPIQTRVSLSQDLFDAVRAAMEKGLVPVRAERNTGKGKPAFGTLSHIDNNIDQTTGTFIARAVFANENEQLWPGMLINLTIDVGEDKQALIIPEVAIQTGPTGKFVFQLENDKAVKAPVTIGRIQDGMAVITEGLTEDSIVITDGIMSLKDGVTVKQVSDDQKTESGPGAAP